MFNRHPYTEFLTLPFPQPAAFSCATWAATLWPSVETRAYP